MIGFICRFCRDRGCLACEGERRKRAEAITELPEPLFVAHLDNPAEMEALKSFLHRDIIEQAFSPGGGGIAEIIRLAEEAKRNLAAGGDHTP